MQRQLVFLFLFSIFSSSCSSEKNTVITWMSHASNCFEILRQIWALGYSFFHDYLVVKTNAELLNTCFEKLQQETTLIKQEHASVYLRAGLVSVMTQRLFVCSALFTGVMLRPDSEERVLKPWFTQTYTHAQKQAINLFLYTSMYLLRQLQQVLS